MDQKAEIKEKILFEINKTERIIADYKELIKPVAPGDAIGRISRMDAINLSSIVEMYYRELMRGKISRRNRGGITGYFKRFVLGRLPCICSPSGLN